MKTKKRQKNTRHRGSHTAGRGAKKKARGSGHRGGVGNSGSGKRGDQKKFSYLNLEGGKYFGKSKTLRKKVAVKLHTINLRDIAEKFSGQNEISLKGYKILSLGELKDEMTIKAPAASKSAIDKVRKSGGEIVLD